MVHNGAHYVLTTTFHLTTKAHANASTTGLFDQAHCLKVTKLGYYTTILWLDIT